jgi:LacI family transcriptional regulator, repressor for deo operon, udp, cdd, tsx, nupC, and nupG
LNVAARPKLNEVADIAGVSLATVSRVLNGKQGVAHPTRQKVLDVLAELGYRDLPVRNTTSGVVGIVTPELDNPIFPLIAQTIESRLARQGMLAMICPATSDTVNEQEYLDHFLATAAAGVVVINGRYAGVDVGFEPYEQLRRRNIPTVLVNGVDLDAPIPSVAVDIKSGGEMGVRHLATLGHKRIGCLIGPQRYTSSLQLLAGYRAGMAKAGLQPSDEYISETLFTIEGGRAGAVRLIEAEATAIVTGGDLMALGAVAGLRSWGYQVPKDVSVVGFDGTTFVSYTDPSLTSVRQPVDRMAQTVVSLLTTPQNGGPTVHLFEPDLVIGGSTGRPPG